MQLYEHPGNLFVANFLGTANILDGKVIENDGRRQFEIAAGARVDVPRGAEIPANARLVFRPQHASVAASGGGTGLPGIVRHREFLGATVRYAVQIGQTEVTVDTSFESGDRLFAPGAAVEVVLPDRALLWLSA